MHSQMGTLEASKKQKPRNCKGKFRPICKRKNEARNHQKAFGDSISENDYLKEFNEHLIADHFQVPAIQKQDEPIMDSGLEGDDEELEGMGLDDLDEPVMDSGLEGDDEELQGMGLDDLDEPAMESGLEGEDEELQGMGLDDLDEPAMESGLEGDDEEMDGMGLADLDDPLPNQVRIPKNHLNVQQNTMANLF